MQPASAGQQRGSEARARIVYGDDEADEEDEEDPACVLSGASSSSVSVSLISIGACFSFCGFECCFSVFRSLRGVLGCRACCFDFRVRRFFAGGSATASAEPSAALAAAEEEDEEEDGFELAGF
mgnify:CR=1 FL=1